LKRIGYKMPRGIQAKILGLVDVKRKKKGVKKNETLGKAARLEGINRRTMEERRAEGREREGEKRSGV